MRTTAGLAIVLGLTAAVSGQAQVIRQLPPALGGNPAGEWSADSAAYLVYVPPDLSWLNLTFSGKLRGRFTVQGDSAYTASYTAAARATLNLGPIFGQQSFNLSDSTNATGQYTLRGTRMIIVGLDSARSVDTLSYTAKADSLVLMLPVTDPRVTALGIRLTLVLPFFRTGSASSLSADFDGNGSVGFEDFFLFTVGFGKRRGEVEYDPRFDLNSDGEVEFEDLFLFAAQFGGKG